MIPVTFTRGNERGFQNFIIMSSTDMFWEARDLFGCGYFTLELQAALRRWLEKEHFLIRDFSPERMQEKFAEFLADSADVGWPLELLVQWLARGVEADKTRDYAMFQWQSALICLARPDEPIPPGIDRIMYRDCLALFLERSRQPERSVNAFLETIKKEWDCYPDDIAPGQKEYNIRNKSDWDRTIYVDCVLFYEMYVDVALSKPFDGNAWQDFVLTYVRSFDDYQKEQFYEIVAPFARQQEFVPEDGLILPIEALLSPVLPITAVA